MESNFKVGDVVTSKATNTPRMTIQGFLTESNNIIFAKESTEWVLCNYYNHNTNEFLKYKFNIMELVKV